jgi:flagellar biosynthesis protein FliR
MNDPKVYTLFAAWLLVFVRVIGFFVQAPIWGAFTIYPFVPIPKQLFEYGTAFASGEMTPLIFLICGQFVIGLVLGYVAYIIMAAVQYGAELLDVQMGLSVAAQMDPAQGSVNMLRRMMFYVAMIVYLLLNGHMKALEAFKYSFEVIPLTGVRLTPHLINDLTTKTGLVFSLGLQIASPVVAALFVTQVALGLLARVAPQMNVFMLSFPLNIMIGLTLLASMLLMLHEKLSQLFDLNLRWLIHTIRLLGAGGA